MPEHDRQTRIDGTDASGGSKSGVVRWVLGISLTLAIVAMSIIWITGALSQNDVEGAGTATARDEAQREQAAPERSSIDGVVTDRDAATGDDQ